MVFFTISQSFFIMSGLSPLQTQHFTELQSYCFTHLEAMHAIKCFKKTRGNAYKIINMYKMAESEATKQEKKDFIQWFINLDNDPQNEKLIVDLLYKNGYTARLADRRYREAKRQLDEGWHL